MKYIELVVGLAWLIPALLVQWLVLIPLGWVLVFIKLKLGRDMSKGLYSIDKGRPVTYWEAAWRNPVNGFQIPVSNPDKYTQIGNVEEPTPDGPRFQYRFRFHGAMLSSRLVWRYNKKHYGESYIGWKWGSVPGNRISCGSSLIRPWATIGN